MEKPLALTSKTIVLIVSVPLPPVPDPHTSFPVSVTYLEQVAGLDLYLSYRQCRLLQAQVGVEAKGALVRYYCPNYHPVFLCVECGAKCNGMGRKSYFKPQEHSGGKDAKCLRSKNQRV